MKLFPELTTHRLLLRELRQVDWKDVSFLRSDPKVNKYVKRPPAETKEKAMAFIDRITTGVKGGDNYYWVITEKGKLEMIGSICLWNFSQDGQKAEIGYDLKPDHQGKGFMNEALKAILDFGFRSLQLKRIEAYTHGGNKSSRRLLEKNGFALEDGKKDAENENNVIYFIEENYG